MNRALLQDWGSGTELDRDGETWQAWRQPQTPVRKGFTHGTRVSATTVLEWKVLGPRKTSDVIDLSKELRVLADRVGVDSSSPVVRDAIQFVGQLRSRQRPRLEITEDGAVVIHWQSDRTGLLAILVGDGTVTYSIKRPGTTYAVSGVEIDLSQTIPEEIGMAIADIERDTSVP